MTGEEVLRCVYPGCNREVRVVRLGRSLLTLGHRSNPGPNKHYVQLAPVSSSAVDVESSDPGRPEGQRRRRSRASDRARSVAAKAIEP